MKKISLLPLELNDVETNPERIPYGVKSIKAPQVWKGAKQGTGNVVAVIDSGCQIDHPDLKENIIDVRNFTTDDGADPENVKDYLGHGTHISGTIAAANNGFGVVGVAPKTELLVLKVIDESGAGTYEHLVEAIDYAINWRGPNKEQVSIINISLGGPEGDPELLSVINKAIRKGIVIVAAAGNYGDNNEATDEILYPAAYKKVIQVGSTNRELTMSPYSNSNQEIDFIAPGKDILSTYPTNTYARLTGTSMAAPHITGAIALILNQLAIKDQTEVPRLVFDDLINKASSLGFDQTLEGHGFVTLG